MGIRALNRQICQCKSKDSVAKMGNELQTCTQLFCEDVGSSPTRYRYYNHCIVLSYISPTFGFNRFLRLT